MSSFPGARPCARPSGAVEKPEPVLDATQLQDSWEVLKVLMLSLDQCTIGVLYGESPALLLVG